MTFSTLLQSLPTGTADTTAKAIVQIEETIGKLAEMPKEELFAFLLEKCINIGLTILAAIIIYTVGAWLIRRIKKIIGTVLEKRKIEHSLSTFILSFTSISLTVLLIVITIQTLGVDTSSFVALLAGSGLAVGMALSGTLQNFSGGIMILIFKPFKVGDYIEAQGYEGTVVSIEITATVLKTPDNRTITLPNGALSSGTINNYSTAPVRRCDWSVNIPYGSDLERAKELIAGILKENKLVLDTPAAPFIALGTLGNGSITITVRAWVKNEDYWSLYYYFNETIYRELPKNGFDFPVPRMNVNLLKEEE